MDINRIKQKVLQKGRFGWSGLLFAYITSDYEFLKDRIDKLFPIYKEIVEVLGVEKCAALRFRRKYLINELRTVYQLDVNKEKIIELLDLEIGQFYSSKELKVKLQGIYDLLGIKDKAKSVNVLKWYDMNERVSTVKEKRIRGYVVVSKRVVP